MAAGLEAAPESKAEKKKELREQRRRLQDAAKRRLTAGQSPRPAPGRTGSATPPYAAMPAPCSGLQHSND